MKSMTFKWIPYFSRVFLLFVASVFLTTGVGCDHSPTDVEISAWVDLIDRLGELDHLPELNGATSRMISSFDPNGENDDYNQFLRREGDWAVIADIDGPGYLSRFWMTGASKVTRHRIRFFFDNERKPSLDLTLGELGGGLEPFIPPLAADEHASFYSYVPVPFKKRCVVMVELDKHADVKPNGWPRMFYQINYTQLPKDAQICTFTLNPPAPVAEALSRVRKAWTSKKGAEVSGEGKTVHLDPGCAEEVEFTGPAVIRELGFEPQLDPTLSATDRFNALRDLVLRVTWDDAEAPSIEVPFRDFFGDIHGGGAFESLCFGRNDDLWWVRYPMPFRKSARIELRNEGGSPVTIVIHAKKDPVREWNDAWGYLHATWSRTRPSEVGKAHPVLYTKGRGKFIGCHIGLVSYDKSFWAVEADETIRVDGEAAPSWRGTGLEDYANLGWYGLCVLPRAIHGMSFLAPYRMSEYRMHLTDPVLFSSEFDMEIERGPRNASHVWMETVAYYYMSEPLPSGSLLGDADSRIAPPDSLAKLTLMTELWQFERLDDLQGATDYIDRYLALNPDFSFVDTLRLRQMAYRGQMQYPAWLDSPAAASTNDLAQSYIKTLKWYQEDPSHALLGAYCSTPTTFYLDGVPVGRAGDPERMIVWKRSLKTGRHVLAIEHEWVTYPHWIQGCLRTHQGDIGTTTDWKHAINPTGNWATLEYDDSTWVPVGRMGTKRPPIEPYFLWVTPDPFIDMQSKAVSLRSTIPCPEKRGTVVYRKVFEIE